MLDTILLYTLLVLIGAMPVSAILLGAIIGAQNGDG